jgi:trehalose 6-phosphate phosphatase
MHCSIPDSPPPADLLRDASLFLDFDGTLVDLAPRPDMVVVDARLRALMERLTAVLNGRIAIISGRPLAQIRGYFGPAALTMSGSHGVERVWADGRSLIPDTPGWLAGALARAEAFGARHPGVLIEAKPFGLALHYRLAPEAEAACRALAEAIAADAGVIVQPGKMVFEVRAAGGDKGDALRAFMADPLMAGTRPVFIGDDVTDEAAFAAATALGGAGVLVGEPRPTAAGFRLENVAATIGWLEASTSVPA